MICPYFNRYPANQRRPTSLRWSKPDRLSSNRRFSLLLQKSVGHRRQPNQRPHLCLSAPIHQSRMYRSLMRNLPPQKRCRLKMCRSQPIRHHWNFWRQKSSMQVESGHVERQDWWRNSISALSVICWNTIRVTISIMDSSGRFMMWDVPVNMKQFRGWWSIKANSRRPERVQSLSAGLPSTIRLV